MIEDNRTPTGRAVGVRVSAEKKRNFMIKKISIPFPAISSKDHQSVCMTKINKTTKKVAKNGSKKLLII
jgi:hypothetical protein